MNQLRALRVAVAVSVFIAATAACQSRDTPATSPAAEADLRARASERAAGAHDAPSTTAPYDLKFIDTMIVHHQGAVDMAKMATTRAQHEELKAMAAKMVADQQREIDQLKTWRQQWYAGAPNAADHAMPGMHE